VQKRRDEFCRWEILISTLIVVHLPAKINPPTVCVSLHRQELNQDYRPIYSSKSRRLRCAGLVARMGERRGTYRVLVGKLEGRRPLGRPRRRWEDNIKMDLREVG
jgi:hypothetical protein